MARALLLKRPSPFAYPGGKPGFDPSHIAAKGLLGAVSVVAGTGGVFTNLLNPTPPTLIGAATSAINGLLGGVCKFAAGAIYNSFPAGDGVTTTPCYTVAAILSPTATTPDGIIVGYTAGGPTTGIELRSLQLSTMQSDSGGFPATSGLSLTAGRSYFVAASVRDGLQTWLTLDLATGAIKTANTTGSGGALDPCNQIHVGGSGSVGSNSSIAAAYLAQGVFLGIPQLKAWAQDPWAFWYPRTLDLTMMLKAGSAGGSTGAASGAGVATVTGVGASTFAGVGSSSGAGTTTGIFSFTATATGSSAGSATVSGVGASIFAGVASTSGSGVATGVGASTFVGVGNSSGLGTVTGVGVSTFSGVGNAAGISSVTGIWNAPGAGAGSTSGTSTTTGVGASTFASIGASTATGNATGVGAWTFSAVGVTAGVSTTTGLSPSVTTAVGVSIGISTVTGIGPAVGGGQTWRWLEGYREAVQQPSHSEEIKKAAAVLSKMGGHARASSLTAKQRSNIASTAAKARWK